MNSTVRSLSHCCPCRPPRIRCPILILPVISTASSAPRLGTSDGGPGGCFPTGCYCSRQEQLLVGSAPVHLSMMERAAPPAGQVAHSGSSSSNKGTREDDGSAALRSNGRGR